jgi:hypothetical protein
MKHSLVLSLAFALTPVGALAQGAPPPPPDAGAPTAGQRAAMQQLHAQMEQNRLQTRSRMLAALSPAHRTAIANIVGQLVLSPNPDPRAAAQALDAALSPAEKQSVLVIHQTDRANMEALMQQHQAQFESSMTPEQRAEMQQREAKMQAFKQSHPRPEANDAGLIVLHTLGTFGGHEMHGPGMHDR